MQALGMIETRGTLAAIEAADAMLKAAEVALLQKTKVGGGLVTVTVTGDVAAVHAAVDAGAGAVERLGEDLLVTRHVIARPCDQMDVLFPAPDPEPQPTEAEASEAAGESAAEAEPETPAANPELTREWCDEIARTQGTEKLMEELQEKAVVKLRNLARHYPDFPIAGREISKANRTQLLTEFENWYKDR